MVAVGSCPEVAVDNCPVVAVGNCLLVAVDSRLAGAAGCRRPVVVRSSLELSHTRNAMNGPNGRLRTTNHADITAIATGAVQR